MKKDVRFWLTELEQAGRHESKWRKRGREVIKTYRDERDTSDTRFNILWANTQTQLPALYSATPKCVVSRRNDDEGPVIRLASTMLEKAVRYSLDPGGAYDFDRVGKRCVLDFLLPGRAVARVKYKPTITKGTRQATSQTPPKVGDADINEDGMFVFDEEFDELVDEEVRIHHVPWDQYRQSVANCWEDVWWVAYGNNFLTREEIIEQFGEEHSDVPMTHLVHSEEEDGDTKEGEGRQVQRAQVWEIWDRDDRMVYAVVSGYDKLLMEEEDPLKLNAFFPSPEPALIVETTDTTIPIPEYTQYQYQAEELNKVTQRIERLVDAMKLSGIYPGSQKEILDQMLKSKENTLVPVEDWGAITERGGLHGMIEWIPLRDVADAWQRLSGYRSTLVAEIYEVTGISDIQRGSTDPRETKGAQQIKASFASRRLLPKQQETQRFFRDLFRLEAEVIAEHFSDETLFRMASVPPSPEAQAARQLIKDDALRSYVIDIETDSTIAPDEAMEKQGVAEFVAAMSQYLNQVLPIVQAQPKAMGPLGAILLWITRKFKIARDAEEQVEGFLQAFSQMPQQQDQEAQAAQAEQQGKMQMAQGEMQMKMQIAQAEQARKDQESQAEIQRKAMELQAQLERERQLAELQQRKLLLDIAEKEAKIRLMQEEAEAKVTLEAVDRSAKRMQEQSKATEKPSQTPAIEVSESKPKAQKITLVKGKDGKVEGAEIAPLEEKKRVRFERDGDDRISGAEVE